MAFPERSRANHEFKSGPPPPEFLIGLSNVRKTEMAALNLGFQEWAVQDSNL